VPADVTYRFGEWKVEPTRNRLLRLKTVQTLPPKAMDVLVCLLERPDKVVSVTEIIKCVWPGRLVEESSVHQRIAQIRRVLSSLEPDEMHVETIPRRGYRLTGAVTRYPQVEPGINPARRRTIAIPNLRNLTSQQSLNWLAEGLSEHLRHQVALWQGFDVLPGAFLKGQEIPAGTELLADGYLQVQGEQIIISLELIDLVKKKRLWSERFTGTNDDPYELQQQMASGIARILGESLTPSIAPSQPAAYAAFLRMLAIQSYGDYDRHHRYLRDALKKDPEWYWGWVDLASLLLRMAIVDRQPSLIDEVRAILNSKAREHSRVYAKLVHSWLATYWDGDLDLGEQLARSLAQKGTGWPYGMLLMASGLFREAEAYFQHQTETDPYVAAGWEMLVETRVLLGDPVAAAQAARSLKRLYPPEALNALTMVAWPLVFADDLEEASKIVQQTESLLTTLIPGIQYRMTAKSLAKIRFELAMRQGDRARAVQSMERIHALGDTIIAGIFALRLQDPRAKTWLSEPFQPQFHRFWWWKTRALISEDIADHPDIQRLNNAIGFTRNWCQDLAHRVAHMPSDSFFSCDPSQYQITVNGDR